MSLDTKKLILFKFSHGYLRYNDIIKDPRFAIINEPFKNEEGKQNFQEVKHRFLQRRYKLLEQALIIEEQLRRAANLQYGNKPAEENTEKVAQNGNSEKKNEVESDKKEEQAESKVESLEKRYVQIEALVDANQTLAREALGGNKQASVMIQKVLSQLEEILNDMKSDVSRLPSTVAQLPGVCKRLEMSERRHVFLIQLLLITAISAFLVA